MKSYSGIESHQEQKTQITEPKKGENMVTIFSSFMLIGFWYFACCLFTGHQNPLMWDLWVKIIFVIFTFCSLPIIHEKE